jgi:hypothetical protein
MHINNLPTEVFVQILEHIPLKDASAVMRVNKEWYQEYRAIIQKQEYAKFEEILYSSWTEWNIPIRLLPYHNWHKFLLDKLISFHENFGTQFSLMEYLVSYYKSLKLEMMKIDKEREVIDNLLKHYEASPDFEGWFPEWLWNRHKNCRWNSGTNIQRFNLVYTLMKRPRIHLDYYDVSSLTPLI